MGKGISSSPSITMQEAFMEANVWADTTFIQQWLSVWALKSGRAGDRLLGMESIPASPLAVVV